MRPATQTSFENPSRSRSDVSGLRPVGRDARDAAGNVLYLIAVSAPAVVGDEEHRRAPRRAIDGILPSSSAPLRVCMRRGRPLQP